MTNLVEKIVSQRAANKNDNHDNFNYNNNSVNDECAPLFRTDFITKVNDSENLH
jgi:hypothetical protein